MLRQVVAAGDDSVLPDSMLAIARCSVDSNHYKNSHARAGGHSSCQS